MNNAGKMIMRAGVFRESKNGPYRIIVYAWVNTSDRDDPTDKYVMSEIYQTEAEAED